MNQENEETLPSGRHELSIILAMLQQIRADLKEHMDGEAERLELIMVRAFPGGDSTGHRLAHEAQMKAVLDKAAFWCKMRFEITKWGLIGLIGWAAVALWLAFVRGMR